MRMTGAEMAVKTMEKNGVKVIFGYPGAANAALIDRISYSSIKHILTRNEQGAAHMASGYGRVTKRTGVCLATSGPGATNLYNGNCNRLYRFYPYGCTYGTGHNKPCR